ncbi:MAG: hypothetical protein WA828_20820 [Coleofasciculaceae cyanobacterium]
MVKLKGRDFSPLALTNQVNLTSFDLNGMNCDKQFDSGHLQVKLQAITSDIRALAHSHQNDSLSLLALLRALEELHREIREDLFQSSLPDNRQALYALLKDIEESGGWPYIDRLKLQLLLCNFPESLGETTTSISNEEQAL